jgi:hypothetical protein
MENSTVCSGKGVAAKKGAKSSYYYCCYNFNLIYRKYIIAGVAIIAYCGELRSRHDDYIVRANSQYIHVLTDNMVIDSNTYKNLDVERVYGRGYLVNEAFEGIANVGFRPNKTINPTYLIGYTLIDVKKGDELLTNYGKEYWCKKAHFESLDPETKKRCKAFYGIKEKDFVK